MADDKATGKTPDLAAEVAALRKELEAVAVTVARIGRAGVGEARGAAEERLAEGAEALGGVENRILAETQAHPWRALGLAALGGLVLGLILRR
jgi:ElaB/YqjD/DUF883 family membrane-anchored ribosome-binding protein